RDLPVDRLEEAGDGLARRDGEAAEEEQPRHPVGPLGRRGPGQGRAHRVPQDGDLLLRRYGVDGRDDRPDHVLGGDAGAVGLPGLHAREGQRHRRVSRRLQGWRHLLPRRPVEPEPGNEDEVHVEPPCADREPNDPIIWIVRTYSYDAGMSSPPAFPDYDLEDLRIIESPEELKAVFHPLRDTILDLLLERAATVTELAEALRRPKSTVAYHVGVLERAGILKVVRTRRVRAIDERFYGRTARTFYVGRPSHP